MKRIISAVLMFVLATMTVLSPFEIGAADINYEEYITNPIETTVVIEGLAKSYKFLQITDSHVVVVSSDTSSYPRKVNRKYAGCSSYCCS